MIKFNKMDYVYILGITIVAYLLLDSFSKAIIAFIMTTAGVFASKLNKKDEF